MAKKQTKYSGLVVKPNKKKSYTGVVVDPKVRDDAEYIRPPNKPQKYWDIKAKKFVTLKPRTKKDLRKPSQRPRLRDWV